MTLQSHIALSRAALVAICLLVSACAGQAPEPTVAVAPELRIVAEVSPAGPPTAVPPIENLPAVDAKPLPTLDAESAAALAPTATSAQRDRGRFIGAIIGEGYVIPPTSTARPSAIPPAAGITLPATPVRSAVTTPLPLDQIQLDGSQMGIQVHYNFDIGGWERTLQQVAALRVGWIKIQAQWEWLQPDYAGQFEQNFRLFQLHVQEAKKQGNKIMLSIAKAPDWARNVNRNEDGPPDDLRQLRGFIGVLLNHLGPYIDAIEIWNEPNLMREWSGDHAFNGTGYMELFRMGYDAVREYSSDIIIITAGLAPTGNSQNVAVNDRSFLQQMYQAGLAGYSDVVIGIHPYSWGNPPDFVCCDNVDGQGWDDRPQFFFMNNIRDYSEIIRANGHNAQMWVTEFGWGTWADYPTEAPDPWMVYNSPYDQLDYTMRAFQIGQSRADIGVMILWNLSFAHEITVGQRSELAAYSILIPAFDGSDNRRQRPLYQALASRT